MISWSKSKCTTNLFIQGIVISAGPDPGRRYQHHIEVIYHTMMGGFTRTPAVETVFKLHFPYASLSTEAL
jgi:hypothetical protein